MWRSRERLQSVSFEQADDGENDPDDRDITRVVERLAEGGDDRGDVEPRGEAGGERRGHDDEQRIEAEQEARDDDQDADQHEHGWYPFVPSSPRGVDRAVAKLSLP